MHKLELTTPQWCAVACGFLAAVWVQIPRADAVLLVLMCLDLFVGIANAIRAGKFDARMLRDGVLTKFIVFTTLIGVHVIKPLLPSTTSVPADEWFATGLCVYEIVSIFKTYTDATGRSAAIATRFQSMLGGARSVTDATGRHVIPAEKQL